MGIPQMIEFKSLKRQKDPHNEEVEQHNVVSEGSTQNKIFANLESRLRRAVHLT
jgi:hypothetical protein